jgi:hypothetical protein
LAGNHRILAGEQDHDAVKRIQEALIVLGYPLQRYGADGNYQGETSTAISKFKADRSISPSDPVVGPQTMAALDRETPPGKPTPTPSVDYGGLKAFYTNAAFLKAFPAGRPAWRPEDGFDANRPILLQLYSYYRTLHLLRPEQFLWAGLGRMAGGAVLGGLQNPVLDDTSSIVRVMLRIGKDIFLDLAWLHEAFLDNPAQAIQLAHAHDQHIMTADYSHGEPPSAVNRGHAESYGAAWEKIDSGDPGQIAEGNRMLLANEQWSIIQPHYDYLLATLDFVSQLMFMRTSAFAGHIHPYHRDFIVAFPTSNVLIAEDRWNWITESGGMMEKWIATGAQERNRLISLDMDAIIAQRFGIWAAARRSRAVAPARCRAVR